jgi:hypothetical protein
MSFAKMQNGVIDELIIEKILEQLQKRAPLTHHIHHSELKRIIALVRLCEEDMKAIEKHMIANGLITRSGKNVYF